MPGVPACERRRWRPNRVRIAFARASAREMTPPSVVFKPAAKLPRFRAYALLASSGRRSTGRARAVTDWGSWCHAVDVEDCVECGRYIRNGLVGERWPDADPQYLRCTNGMALVQAREI